MNTIKNKTTEFILISFIVIFSIYASSCSNSEKREDVNTEDNIKPINLSIFLDLSDRIARELTPSQVIRDSLIIDNIIDIFIDDCIKNGKIIRSNNHIQIFFHPAPQNTEIATLANGLNLDLSRINVKDKKIKLKELKSNFSSNISQIYRSTIEDKKWIGSDIWAFFSDKKVDSQCIRSDYRNILVILTDGYLFYSPNKRQEGNAYSYILPQTLKKTDSSLIVKRNGLENLEILLLEVNPFTPIERDRLIEVLEKWFAEMGVEHFAVSDTDMPVNTENVIRNFFSQNK